MHRTLFFLQNLRQTFIYSKGRSLQAALVENDGRLSSTNAIAHIRTVQLYEQPSTWGLPAVPQRWGCGRRRNCN